MVATDQRVRTIIKSLKKTQTFLFNGVKLRMHKNRISINRTLQYCDNSQYCNVL